MLPFEQEVIEPPFRIRNCLLVWRKNDRGSFQPVDSLLSVEGLDLLGLEDKVIDDDKLRVVVRCGAVFVVGSCDGHGGVGCSVGVLGDRCV